MGCEGFLFFGGEEVDLAGESVFVGVEAGAVLAFVVRGSDSIDGAWGCWGRSEEWSFCVYLLGANECALNQGLPRPLGMGEGRNACIWLKRSGHFYFVGL